MFQVSKKFSKGDAVSIILEGMIEVVGRYNDEDEQNYYLTVPHVVQLHADPQTGQPRIALQQYMITANPSALKSLPISKSSIITIVESNDELSNHLRQQDTGIQIATAMPRK